MTPENPTDITVTYFRSFAVILARDTAAMFPFISGSYYLK